MQLLSASTDSSCICSIASLSFQLIAVLLSLCHSISNQSMSRLLRVDTHTHKHTHTHTHTGHGGILARLRRGYAASCSCQYCCLLLVYNCRWPPVIVQKNKIPIQTGMLAQRCSYTVSFEAVAVNVAALYSNTNKQKTMSSSSCHRALMAIILL